MKFSISVFLFVFFYFSSFAQTQKWVKYENEDVIVEFSGIPSNDTTITMPDMKLKMIVYQDTFSTFVFQKLVFDNAIGGVDSFNLEGLKVFYNDMGKGMIEEDGGIILKEELKEINKNVCYSLTYTFTKLDDKFTTKTISVVINNRTTYVFSFVFRNKNEKAILSKMDYFFSSIKLKKKLELKE